MKVVIIEDELLTAEDLLAVPDPDLPHELWRGVLHRVMPATGAHGYAVAPRISASLNEATRKCYDFGGKECVIREWACDARG